MKYNEDLRYLDIYIKEHNKDNSYREECILKLKKGIPIQYIIGSVNFYGYEFFVNEKVLIPRFETELLVDKTIKKIKNKFSNSNISILDLGTGSGCIAITLNKELLCSVDAIDISIDALNVAQYNNKNLNGSVNFFNKDMINYNENKYDVIISNPPYISYNEDIMDIVKNNEPHIALYADKDGLYFYEAIIKNLENITKNKFLVCFEIGEKQADKIVNIINNYITCVNISVEKDYSGKDRYIFIERN